MGCEPCDHEHHDEVRKVARPVDSMERYRGRYSEHSEEHELPGEGEHARDDGMPGGLQGGGPHDTERVENTRQRVDAKRQSHLVVYRQHALGVHKGVYKDVRRQEYRYHEHEFHLQGVLVSKFAALDDLLGIVLPYSGGYHRDQ